jgi:hypothetical protein
MQNHAHVHNTTQEDPKGEGRGTHSTAQPEAGPFSSTSASQQQTAIATPAAAAAAAAASSKAGGEAERAASHKQDALEVKAGGEASSEGAGSHLNWEKKFAVEKACERWDFLRAAVFDGRVRLLLLNKEYSIVTATFAGVRCFASA